MTVTARRARTARWAVAVVLHHNPTPRFLSPWRRQVLEYVAARMELTALRRNHREATRELNRIRRAVQPPNE